MDHLVTFFTLLALLCAIVLVTITLMLRQQFKHQASTWFAILLTGIACFVLEILIYRYANTLQKLSAQAQMADILIFRKSWALAGGVLVTLAMPRLARLMTGLARNTAWWIAEITLPVFAFLAGLAFILNLDVLVPVLVLQGVVFGSVVSGVLFIALIRPGKKSQTDRHLGGRFLVWSALCLPLIILDAVGGILPPFLNDFPISLFLLGLCVVSIPEILKLFGSPVYLHMGQPSSHFVQQFGISNREAEVVALVLQGANNAEIGMRLFISSKTVENHLTNIFRKTHVKNRIQLFRLINSARD